MIALALMGVAAATMADFNLAAQPSRISYVHLTSLTAEPQRSTFRYSTPKWEEAGSGNASGVRVKLKWKRVRLTIPFGAN